MAPLGLSSGGRTVVVTGGNRGIGLEFVRQLVAKGNRVIATARQPAQAEELRQLQGGRGSQSTSVVGVAADRIRPRQRAGACFDDPAVHPAVRAPQPLHLQLMRRSWVGAAGPVGHQVSPCRPPATPHSWLTSHDRHRTFASAVDVAQLDASDPTSVRAFAESVKALTPRVDCMIK